MNLNGPEIIRLRALRPGRYRCCISPSTISGDVPFLDAADLAGLDPRRIEQARKVADALVPACQQGAGALQLPASSPSIRSRRRSCSAASRSPSLADLKGRKVRTNGGSMNDFMERDRRPPAAIGFPEVYGRARARRDRLRHHGYSEAATAPSGTKSPRACTRCRCSWSTAPPIYVNIGWWNKLDPAVRDFMTKTMKRCRRTQQWALGTRGDRGRHRLQQRPGRRLQARRASRQHQPDDQSPARSPSTSELLRKTRSSNVLPAWVKRCGARCGEIYNEARGADHRREVHRELRPRRRAIVHAPAHPPLPVVRRRWPRFLVPPRASAPPRHPRGHAMNVAAGWVFRAVRRSSSPST